VTQVAGETIACSRPNRRWCSALSASNCWSVRRWRWAGWVAFACFRICDPQWPGHGRASVAAWPTTV